MPSGAWTPPSLMTAPFHRRDASAAGLSPDQLRSACWLRLFRSVYVHRSVELTDRHRFDAFRLAAPAGAPAVDRTAAWLFGVWAPAPGDAIPLCFGRGRRQPAFTTGSALSRRLSLDDGDVEEWHGVPVTTPERTCFSLMAGSWPDEAVVWADAFLHSGLVTLSGLRRYADERPHWPHVRKVREALQLARIGAASPMETRLRLVIVGGGLREPPLLNRPIHDEAGRLLGIPDLGYESPRFGIEYDGEYHHDAHQRVSDNRRENRLLVSGFPLLRYGRDDVYGAPLRIVSEVAAMLARRPG